MKNGVDSDHIIEIALDGIENEELRDPKMCMSPEVIPSSCPVTL